MASFAAVDPPKQEDRAPEVQATTPVVESSIDDLGPYGHLLDIPERGDEDAQPVEAQPPPRSVSQAILSFFL
jgi:hypothetical protein